MTGAPVSPKGVLAGRRRSSPELSSHSSQERAAHVGILWAHSPLGFVEGADLVPVPRSTTRARRTGSRAMIRFDLVTDIARRSARGVPGRSGLRRRRSFWIGPGTFRRRHQPGGSRAPARVARVRQAATSPRASRLALEDDPPRGPPLDVGTGSRFWRSPPRARADRVIGYDTTRRRAGRREPAPTRVGAGPPRRGPACVAGTFPVVVANLLDELFEIRREVAAERRPGGASCSPIPAEESEVLSHMRSALPGGAASENEWCACGSSAS